MVHSIHPPPIKVSLFSLPSPTHITPSLPPSLFPPPYSPSLSIFTAQVILVFIIQLHNDHWVLSHAELWAASYSLLQEWKVTSCVSPAQVETLQGEGVPKASKGNMKNEMSAFSLCNLRAVLYPLILSICSPIILIHTHCIPPLFLVDFQW